MPCAYSCDAAVGATVPGTRVTFRTGLRLGYDSGGRPTAQKGELSAGLGTDVDVLGHEDVAHRVLEPGAGQVARTHGRDDRVHDPAGERADVAGRGVVQHHVRARLQGRD